MGFAEALSGDGTLTGCRHLWGHGYTVPFADPEVPRNDDGSFSRCSS